AGRGRAGVSLPFLGYLPRGGIRGLLQFVEALTDGFRVARQDSGDVLNPAMPQLGGLDGRISTSIFLRQPPKESLHLPFNRGCIFFHTILLACRAYAVARILQLKQAGKLFLTVSLAFGDCARKRSDWEYAFLPIIACRRKELTHALRRTVKVFLRFFTMP